MKMTTQFEVLGMKSSKGKMDNGNEYDSTKIFVKTNLDDSKGTAKGFATAEYTIGVASEFDKYKHLPFPFVADAEVEMITTGKAQRMVVHKLTPKQVTKPAQASGTGG